ncbi:MAG TPA: serine hydrolase domain-containing protein [Longimicrobium sp.]|nr:serine hydrolase domain-containing protein [Longimicrobium sp.]
MHPSLQRRRAAARLGLLVAALPLAGACAQPGATLPKGDTEAFAARLDRLRRDAGIPGMAAVVVRGGQVVWQQGFGYADAERRTPVTAQTSFHLASLTKPFASIVVMRLVQEGTVSLEDPVSKYGISLGGPGIVRVKHLLTHTSEGEPGSRYQYNGNRFALLDQVILESSGRSFAELVVEQVIQPLGMMQTAPNPRSAADFAHTGYDLAGFTANLAQGFSSDGRSPEAYPTHFSSAAGLVSSAADVARFSVALDGDALVTAATRERIFTPATSTSGARLPYGLGWFVQQHGAARIVWHYGLWTANSSLIVKVPEQGLTFVLLANTDMLSRPYNLGVDDDVRRSPYARAFLEVFAATR